MDERPSEANEPNNQESHRQALPLRQPPAARDAPRRLHERLQLQLASQGSERSHAIRVHLQMQGFKAKWIQAQSALTKAGTKYLASIKAGSRKAPRSLNARIAVCPDFLIAARNADTKGR